MVIFELSSNKFSTNGRWDKAIEQAECPIPLQLKRFDQTGYHLCPLEQEYANVNMDNLEYQWDGMAMSKDWFTHDRTTGPHINHGYLYERKGFDGEALDQLINWSKENHLLHKMSQIKPKWGIDFSLDYVDEDRSNTMELFHYEWDDNDLNAVLEKKQIIEDLVFSTDWFEFAKYKIEHKDEWIHLLYKEQSAWTTKQLNLPKEKTELHIWST